LVFKSIIENLGGLQNMTVTRYNDFLINQQTVPMVTAECDKK